MIEIAVVPAAGRGTRLGDLTDSIPKPLIDVGGRPVLLRVLDGIAAAGVASAVVVTGYLNERIEEVIRDAPLPTTTVRQVNLDGTATAVLAAQTVVGDRPFLLAWGDSVTDPWSYRDVVKAFEGADASLAVHRVEDPAAGAAVWLEGERVVRIVEKPSIGSADTPWNNAGIFGLPGDAWGHLGAVERSSRGEFEMTDAVVSMIASGLMIRAVVIEGHHIDVGTPETLERARRLFG